MIKFQKINKHLLVTVSVVTFIFLILYCKFIWGDYAYVYYDIGTDTVNSYYPNYIFVSNLVRNHEFAAYSFGMGFGGDTIPLLLSYINPFDAVCLLFNSDNMYIGILLSTYIKTITICIASYYFFARLMNNKTAVMASTIIWSFNSYLILWGQHYQFATAMAYFTLFMLCLQLFLEGNKKIDKWFIIVMVLFCVNNLAAYYFFYMCGIFSVIYTIVYCVFNKKKFKEIILKLFKLGIFAFWAIGIAFVAFVTSLEPFLESTRTDIFLLNLKSLFHLYPINYILTSISRIFSTNYLGIGNFTGTSNYYEASILFTSMLFVFSLIYNLQNKNYKKTLVGIGIVLIAICLPVTSILFTFNPYSFRWTFLLVFIMIISIGTFISKFIDNSNKVDTSKISLVITSISVILIITMLLRFAEHKNMLKIEFIAYAITVIFVILYSLYFGCYKIKYRKIFSVLLLFIICFEVVISSYPTIYMRSIVKKDMLSQKFYNDGTNEVIEYTEKIDQGLFRMNKTYKSVFYKDSMAQGYNGLSTYDSVALSSLVEYLRNLEIGFLQNSNLYISVPYDWQYVNTLLAEKYLISRHGDVVDGDYKLIKEFDDFLLYQNNLALPFGYLYHDMSGLDFSLLSSVEKEIAMTKQFYFTNGENDNTNLDGYDISTSQNEVKKIDLLPYYTNSNNCNIITDQSNMHVTGLEHDMQIYFNTKNIFENDLNKNYDMLSINLYSQYDVLLQVFVETSKNGFTEEKSQSVGISAGVGSYNFPLNKYENITSIRIDPSEIKQDMVIHSAELYSIDKIAVKQNINNLQTNSLKNISFDGKKLKGTIQNENSKGMLCIPIFWDDNWMAKIDGKVVSISNINGGLIGIPLEKGNYNIELIYNSDFSSVISWIITIWCLSAFILYFYVLKPLKQRKLLHEKDT